MLRAHVPVLRLQPQFVAVCLEGGSDRPVAFESPVVKPELYVAASRLWWLAGIRRVWPLGDKL